MTKQDAIAGIAAYKYEQDEITNAIRSNGGSLTEREFDKIFSDFKEWIDENGNTHRGYRVETLRVHNYERGAFLLCGRGRQQRMLEITQIMMAAGLLSAKKEKSGVVYRERNLPE